MSYSGSASTGKNQPTNYFDVNDILTAQEKIPCKIELHMYNLGFLDPSSDSEHLVPGTKMEFPYWIARALCGRNKNIVSIELPKEYRDTYREILGADATVVDLHKLGPYFYAFGTLMLGFDHPDTADIAKTLLQTFQARFRKIMDSSQNAYNEDTTRLTEKLDNSERIVFSCGQQGLNDFQKWETRKTDKISTSIMVKNHRKRKRALMEAI